MKTTHHSKQTSLLGRFFSLSLREVHKFNVGL